MTDSRDGSSLADQLSKLTDLRNSGAITQSEFEVAKKRILGMSEVSASPTLPGRAAAPDAPVPTAVPPPMGSGPAAPGDLGHLPTTEVLPDIPAGGFTLGGLHGEDEIRPPAPPGVMRRQPTVDLDPETDLVPVSELDAEPEPELSVQWRPAGEPAPGESPEGTASPPSPAQDAPLDLVGARPPAQDWTARAPAPAPAVAPGYLYTDEGAAERQAVMDLGGSVTRTAWMIGGGLVALVILLLVLSSGFRVWFGGALFVIGVLVALGGAIWLLVEAARASVLWLILYLFVPFANLAFVIVHWSVSRRPFFTYLAGLAMILVGGLLFVHGTGARKCASKDTDTRSGGGAPVLRSMGGGDDDDVGSPPRRRAVRWRPAGGFSCAALQDRVDDCEDEWVDQLEELLKRQGIAAGGSRISVDRPQVAVKQAQTLVFESGELHRCQVATRRGLPVESEWLRGLGACFAQKRCRSFAVCHTKLFLRYIGSLPFSCRFYCNKEMYQCGAQSVAKSLHRQRGYKVALDEDRLDKVRPKLFAKCLGYCKRKLNTPKIREAALQCMFQPTCKGFLECLEPISSDK